MNRVSRFVLPATNVIDAATEVVLLDNMHSTAGNHNAGDLHFGKDGYLYVSVGDGGCDYLSPFGCAGANQASRNQNTLSGKILRITRDGGVPPDNPFLGSGHGELQDRRCGRRTEMPGDLRLGPAQPVPLRHGPGRPRRAVLHQRRRTGSLGGDRPGREGRRLRLELPRGGARQPRGGLEVLAGAAGARRSHLRVRPHELRLDHRGRLPAHRLLAVDPRRELLLQRLQLRDDLRARSPGGRRLPSSDFATALGASSAVHLVFGPYLGGTGLYYTNYQGGGQVRVIAFTGTANRSPQARLAASPTIGAPPLSVTFDATGSSDPDGDALTFVWDFGDGSPVTETTTAHHGAHLPGAGRLHRDPPGQGQLGRALGPRGRDHQRREHAARAGHHGARWRATSSASASR